MYLAGPITGHTYEEAAEWRADLVDWLHIRGIDAYSPLRLKQYLTAMGVLEAQYQGVHPLSDDKGIVARDFNDVTHRDMLLVNFLGAERISIGTVWEIGVAYAARKPICLVQEKGNIHEHAMLNVCADFTVDNLEDAVEIVTAVLLP